MNKFPYTQISRARCKEILIQAHDAAKLVCGMDWSANLDKVMTADERKAVKAVWETLPGHFSFCGTLTKMAHGRW